MKKIEWIKVYKKLSWFEFNKKTKKKEYMTELEEGVEIKLLKDFKGYCWDCDLTTTRNDDLIAKQGNGLKTCVGCNKPFSRIWAEKK